MNTASPLFTDLYQLTMALGYWNSKQHDRTAVFELFFRRSPFHGEYAIVAGYDRVQNILDSFRFSKEEIQFLKNLSVFKNADASFFEYLETFDLKDIQVDGIAEGQLAFPRIPILRIQGPLLKVQLLESALLNAVNFATLVASYARRITLVAPDKNLMEFGLRRAQGPNGAMTATRSSFIGGFHSTSNVLGGLEFGIPVVGTMAHSFVQSFSEMNSELLTWEGKDLLEVNPKLLSPIENGSSAGELAAFLAYAQAFPNSSTLLLDTYNVLNSGLPNAIQVFKTMKKLGLKPQGIRLDSGDLVYLSRIVREQLDAAELQEVKIVASNELDEAVIESIQKQGAQIDIYGIGTRLVTASQDPSLGGVYKLVELDRHPRFKISEQTEKIVIPGKKNAYRFYGKDGVMLLDFLTTADEAAPLAGQEILALHPTDPYRRAKVIPSKVEKLLSPLFQNGKWIAERKLDEIRISSIEAMKRLRPDVSRHSNPTPYKISLSEKLKAQFDKIIAQESPTAQLS